MDKRHVGSDLSTVLRRAIVAAERYMDGDTRSALAGLVGLPVGVGGSWPRA